MKKLSVLLAAFLLAHPAYPQFSGPKPVGFGYSFGPTNQAGTSAYLVVPFPCNITQWAMTADSGTATVDVWKIASGASLPTVSNTITASAKPAISTGQVAISSTLTGWTTRVNRNDVIGFNLSAKSAGTATVSIVLACTR